LTDSNFNMYYETLGVSVTPMAPATPNAPTVSNITCTTATLTRGTPPSGVTWYWQGTNSSGTSTANSSSTYSATSATTYYLRAQDDTTESWSTSSASVYAAVGTQGGPSWYADTDGDGFGDPNSSIAQCTQPTGYVSNNTDACPTESNIIDGCPDTSGYSDENYVYTVQPQVAMEVILDNTAAEDLIESITYFDGLGRPVQNIGVRQSNSSTDIITHIDYDDFGRQDKDYLPYVPSTSGNEGTYRTNDQQVAIIAYYNIHHPNDLQSGSENPYSQKELESSPLSRVIKQAAPGKDWELGGGNEIEFDYQSNATGEVKDYYATTTFANDTYTPALNDNGTYTADELYKTITRDENHSGTSKNHTTEEFKDKQGRVVLKRTYANVDLNGDGDTNDTGETEVAHDTYYVYDEYGNLTYVLPPKMEAATANVSTIKSQLNDLGYQYKYDIRNRLVEKKIPGKGRESIVYNLTDQPVLTQDTILYGQNKWLFIKYDAFGRMAYSGIKDVSKSRINFQVLADNPTTYDQFETQQFGYSSLGGVDLHYNNVAIPTTMTEITIVNYYDNYDFLTTETGITLPSSNTYEEIIITNVKGLSSWNMVKVLETTNWITTVTGYNKKGLPIWVYSENDYLNTTDIVETKFNFIGNVEESTTTHKKTGDNDIVIVDKFTYDHTGRLTEQTQKIDNGTEEVIAQNTYDKLGQLASKGVGGDTTQVRLQTVDYKYNIRGWLKQINDVNNIGTDLFAFNLKYNDIADVNKKLYNGNISQTLWRTANTDNSLKDYEYTYDALNRITSGIDNTGNYNLTSVAYDKNGNITDLERKGHTNVGATSFGVMDNLVYTYETNSNKLKKLLDNGNDTYGFKDGVNQTTEYTYDTNGNLLTDANKGITSITYNHLNLPKQVTFSGGNIQYKYDATGIKQKKIVSTGITTLYGGNFIYEGTSGYEDLQFFNHAEGYVEPNGSSFDYVYQYKDHLGNVRLSYADSDGNGSINASTEIIEENNYYPFGLKHKGYNSNVISEDKYHTFQGQEEEKELGKNTYAFQWRDYDPAIGRFSKTDRFSEKYYSTSPYGFSKNSPIFFREIKGDSINVSEIYRKVDGEYVNKTQKEAFEFFANTKVGKKFLSHFASKGQEVAGVKYNSNGKYHNEGIDLNYGNKPTGYNTADTSVGQGNNRKPDENGRFQITVNLGAESNKYESLLTVVHETFIHADRDAKDIMHNGKADHSIIDRDFMSKNPQNRHHYQEQRNNWTSPYQTDGYSILKQYNNLNKIYGTNEKVWGTMFNFRL